MTKKKRQYDHVVNVGDSSESNEDIKEKSAGASCPHINKAVHLMGVKKVLKNDSIVEECVACVKAGNKDDETEDFTVLLCLKCGHFGCNSGLKHAEQHSKNRQSDVHDLSVNPVTWTVWCYKCEADVPPDSSKKLLECVEFIRKNYIKSNRSMNGEVKNCQLASIILNTSSLTKNSPLKNSTSTIVDSLPRIRGLSNLGNTCFFNAVLQCLSQTPFLLSVLEEMKEPGEKFRLPGGEVIIGEEKEILEPLEGVLKEWGPLTKTLADTLEELQSGKSDVFYPRKLLTLLHSKCPQFAGYDQHDSHELLRQLLETVRTEDLQRYQSSILENLKLEKRCERENISEEQRRKVKAYGRQANDLMLRPEQVFRGFLVSTLECQECFHISEHIESFLDLSLPVMSDKPVHVRRRSVSDELEADHVTSPSKHQLKKERKARGRKFKRRSGHSDGSVAPTITEENRRLGDESNEEESDADVEDNAEPEVTQGQDVIESGYSSEKAVNGDSACGSPASESNLPLNRDSALASPIANDVVPSKPLLYDVLDTSIPSSSKETKTISSPCHSSETRFVLVETEDSNNNKLDLLNSELNKLEIETNNNTNNNNISSMKCSEDNDSEEGKVCEGSKYSVNCYRGSTDCTVHSCLNQFTAKELLTGNNKVGCDACTERHHQGKEGKTVLTNASKQLLISTPPAVLILHLKRFQVVRCIFKKKCREVKFPTILDLAQYCSLKNEDGSVSRCKSNQVLYSLYGVVEHSGTLYGGHYVAYVKVRAPLSRDDPRWSFLPRRNLDDTAEEVHPSVDTGAVGGMLDPPGKWYYVSDSRVSEVKEENVLQTQAYLLFYERIL